MTTLNELITEVKEHLNMRDTSPTTEGTPTLARITRQINQARRMIYSDLVAAQKRRFGTSASLVYAAATSQVALAAGYAGAPIFKVEARATSATQSFTLDPLVIEEFRNLSLNGTPLGYAIVGGYIQLRPRPAVEYTLTIWYAPILADLSSGSASPSELNAQFHHLISTHAAIRLKASLGDPVESLQEIFDTDFAILVRFYGGLIDDNHAHDNVDAEDYYG